MAAKVCICFCRVYIIALASVTQLGIILCIQKWLVGFPEVKGTCLGCSLSGQWVCARGSTSILHSLIDVSLSLYHPLSLKVNKLFFLKIYSIVLNYVRYVVITDFSIFNESLPNWAYTSINFWNLNAQCYTVTPVIFYLASISLLFSISKPLTFWCSPHVNSLSWLYDIWKL